MEDSELEKDETVVAIQKRIEAPLEWVSPGSFARIIDLEESRYEQVIRLIKHHSFKDDPMCKASSILDDSESVGEYLNLVRVWIKDSTSIVALSSTSGRVIGTAITRVNSRLDRSNGYSRIEIFQGKALEKIMRLKSTLVKQTNPYKLLGHDTMFRVYTLCVHPSYRNKGLENALLENCIRIARSLELPAIVGIFSSGATQKLAADLGFRVLSEIRYSRWIVDDVVVFDNPGIDNYSAAFMGMIVSPTTQET